MNRTFPETYRHARLSISRSSLDILVVFSVLLIGGAIRYWNITVGLPNLYEHDEIFEANRALELLRGEYNFDRIKGMYFYLLSSLAGIYGAVVVFQGAFSDFESFIAHSIVHPGNIILLSRCLCAALGILSIFLVYRLGKQIFPVDSFGPLLLGLAWATCGLAIWVSRWGLIENTVLVFGLLAFLVILHLFETPSYLNYLVASALIAGAVATKIYAVLLLVPLVFAHVVIHSGHSLGQAWRTLFHGKLIMFFLGFSLSLMVLNPVIFLKLMETGEGSEIIQRLSVETEATIPLPFYFKHLRWNLGNMGILFFVIGVVAAIVRFEKKVCTCAIFALGFFLTLGLHREAVFIFDRYLLISLPSFFVVAVYGIEVVRKRAQDMVSQVAVKRMITGCIFVLASFGVTWNGIAPILANPIMDRSFVPVHQQALTWFESHVPARSTVVIRGEDRPWPGNQNIPLYDLKENYLHLYEEKKKEGKGPAEISYLRELAIAGDVVRYNLVNETRYVLWKHPVEYLENHGAEYFVVDVEHFSSKFTSRRSMTATESRRRFYQNLRSSKDVTLIQTFRGHTIIGGPRTLEVYKVRDPGSLLASKNHD